MPKRRGPGELPRVFKRASDGLFVARVQVGRTGGKLAYEVFTARTREAAVAKRADRIAELEQAPGTRADRRNQTVAQFFQRWIKILAPPARAEGTYRARRMHVEKYVVPELGHLLLRQLAADDLIRLYGSLADRPSVAKPVHVTIRMGLAAAKRWHEIVANVADDVGEDRPTYTPPKIRPPALEAVQAFLAAAESRSDPLHCWWLLAAHGAFRPCELHGLEWRDVDWAARTLSIARRRSTVGAPVLSEGAKTGAGVRTVILPQRVIEALRAHRRRQVADVGVCPLVFCDAAGQPLRGFVVREAFAAAAGGILPEATRPYDLRHVHATELLRQRVPDLVIARRLGHANTRTLGIYAHPDLEMDDLAAAAFDRALETPPRRAEDAE